MKKPRLQTLPCASIDEKREWLRLLPLCSKAERQRDIVLTFCSDCDVRYRGEMHTMGSCVRAVDWQPPWGTAERRRRVLA